MQIEDLRNMSEEDLLLNLSENEKSLQKLIQSKHSSKEGTGSMRCIKNTIAMCKRVMHENKLKALVKKYTGKKHLPKELRPKLNKALRMKLTKRQQNLKSRKQRIHEAKYPKKIFSYSP